jgi:23S rRNA (uracil1939-C5)-methyltransferase
MNRGDKIDLSITSLALGGEGIARHDGMVLFVPRALPGDQIRASIVRPKKRYASGRIDSIIEPSQHRVEPDCKWFDAGCGGCQWLHFSYEEQLRWKKQLLKDALGRIGRFETNALPIEEIIPAEKPRGCRSKYSATLTIDGDLGLCIENSKTVLPIDACPMESPACNRALGAFRDIIEGPRGSQIRSIVKQVHLRASEDDERVSLCFFAETNHAVLETCARELVELGAISAAGVSLKRGFNHLAGDRSLSVRCGKIEYEVPTDVFFQTNYSAAETLLRLICDGIELPRGAKILDLYSGVGFFSLDLALEGYRVTGVEGHPAGVAAAKRTARKTRIKSSFLRQRVEPDLFGSASALASHYDAVVLDPPRSGCGTEISNRICDLEPEVIAYVSCAPDTLARDLRAMVDRGYEISRCTPLDMFPQTYHVESVTILKRQD